MGIKFAEPQTADTSTQLQSTRNTERDEDLKALDALVGVDVKRWIAAGKPVAMVADKEGNMVPNPFAVFMRLAVPKNQVANFKQDMVRRSCLLHGCDPVYMANTPDAEGFTAVKWTFTDHLTDKQKKEQAEAAEKAAKAAEGNGQAQAEGDQPQGDQPQGDQPEGTGDEGGEQPQTQQKGRGLLGGRR